MATLSSGNNVLDFNVCQSSDCTSFSFNEETGLYTTSNSGGWAVVAGAGALVNFTPSDAIDARLIVTLPDGTICPAITLYPTFPDSTSLLTQTVTSTNLGLSGSLPDGIYIMEYQVDISNVSSQTVQLSIKKSFLLSCTIWCCVQKLIAKIPTEDCSCEDKAMKNAILAFSLYQALLHAGSCGNTTNVTNLLTRLDDLCDISDCGCS